MLESFVAFVDMTEWRKFNVRGMTGCHSKFSSSFISLPSKYLNDIVKMRNARDTLFSTLSLTSTFLLDEINVYPTTLSGTHFQSVRPT